MPESTQTSPWATIREAADYYGVHPKTIQHWIRDGLLPAYRIGPNTTRIKRSDLDAVQRTVTRKVSSR